MQKYSFSLQEGERSNATITLEASDEQTAKTQAEQLVKSGTVQPINNSSDSTKTR